ncbi:hypothetical protein Tco_0562954, partial [Tanacetum coccineum]
TGSGMNSKTSSGGSGDDGNGSGGDQGDSGDGGGDSGVGAAAYVAMRASMDGDIGGSSLIVFRALQRHI